MAKRKYLTEEERKTAKSEYDKKRYWENKENEIKRHKKYTQTPIGRAQIILQNYNRMDKKHNIGKGDLTAKWIVENIFSKPCVHCGKEGWKVIGCNRLDNTKPHTMDNVEPCCKDCNDKLHSDEIAKTVYQYTLDGLLVDIWHSTAECGRNGYNQSCVVCCCNGKLKQHNGYRFSYKPL